MTRSKFCENGPEIVEKKYTVAHSIPDVTPRKNKKVRSVRGTICGVFRYVIVSERLQFFVKFNLLQFIQEILFFKGNY
jgi:hypothetical protein